MGTEHLLDDIQDVNMSYLLLIQRLINTDRDLAMFRLKIDEAMAELLGTMPIADLSRLARCNQLLCHFSLGSADELYALIHSAKNEDLLQTHAAILLAGQENRKGERRKGDRRVADRRTGPDGYQGAERRTEERRKGERRTGARRKEDRST